MSKNYRQGRLGEEIKRIISELLLRGLKDPRLDHMISVTSVEVTSDGSYATVYLTVYENAAADDEKETIRADVIEGLQSSKGVIKNEISRQVKLRHMPELIFKMDTSMEYGRHIDDLIDSVSDKTDKNR